MNTKINVTFTAGERAINTGITDLQLRDIAKIGISNKGIIIASKLLYNAIDSVANGIITYKASYIDEDEIVELPALAEGDLVWVEIDRGAVPVFTEISSQEIADIVERVTAEENND